MSDAIDELVARGRIAAAELNTMSGAGALHIFVDDGNCDSDNLQFCLEQPDITPAEREFVERMLSEFTDEQINMVWAFAQKLRGE